MRKLGLIEVLITIAAVFIIVAIVVPNFLEAQTRRKFTQKIEQQTNMKVTYMQTDDREDILHAVQHAKRKWKRRICLAITGRYFEEVVLDDIIKQIYEFKWLKSEQAGKNLYGSGDEAIIKAGCEWWAFHRDEFLKSHGYITLVVPTTEPTWGTE